MSRSAFTFSFQIPFGLHAILVVLFVVFLINPSLAKQELSVVTDDNDAIHQVQKTIDAILMILNEDHVFEESVWPNRKKDIVILIKERFDFRELSKRALGKHWKKRTKEEQTYFITLFQDVLQNTYIDRLKAYSTERIEFHKQIVNEEKALVYCAFVSKNKAIPMKYRARKIKDSWLVYDIIIEGVSLVGNYRKQFAEIIHDSQYEGLIARMEEKVSSDNEKSQ